MAHPSKQLALRPKAPASPKVVYKHVPHDTQYVIRHTLVGEAALMWSAPWLAGFFCVVDFPAELAAYVHNVLLGPQRVALWEGTEKPFAESLDEVARAGGPFAAVADALLKGHNALHQKLLVVGN